MPSPDWPLGNPSQRLKEARGMVRFDSQLSRHQAEFQLLVIFLPFLEFALKCWGWGRRQSAEEGSGAFKDYLCLLCSCSIVSLITGCCSCGTGLVTQIRGRWPGPYPVPAGRGDQYQLLPLAQPGVGDQRQLPWPRPRGASALLSGRRRWPASPQWWPSS